MTPKAITKKICVLWESHCSWDYSPTVFLVFDGERIQGQDSVNESKEKDSLK